MIELTCQEAGSTAGQSLMSTIALVNDNFYSTNPQDGMKRLWASRSEEACNRRANGRAVSAKCVGRRSPEIIAIDRQQTATRTYLACNTVVLIFQLLNIDCLTHFVPMHINIIQVKCDQG